MPLLDVLASYFQAQEWPVERIEGTTVYRTAFRGEHGTYACLAQTREDYHHALFYVVIRAECPVNLRSEMAQFLTRANYNLAIGNFEMDLGDGEIRYKTSIDVENAAFTPALYHNMVVAAVHTTDRYMPGILAVMSGQVDAITAITAVETVGPAGEA